MTRFTNQFLCELKSALIESPYQELAVGLDETTVHSCLESRRPPHQLIYVTDKATLPGGPLRRVILPVPGLFCVFVHNSKIAAIETLSRDVLDRDAET